MATTRGDDSRCAAGEVRYPELVVACLVGDELVPTRAFPAGAVRFDAVTGLDDALARVDAPAGADALMLADVPAADVPVTGDVVCLDDVAVPAAGTWFDDGAEGEPAAGAGTVTRVFVDDCAGAEARTVVEAGAETVTLADAGAGAEVWTLAVVPEGAVETAPDAVTGLVPTFTDVDGAVEATLWTEAEA